MKALALLVLLLTLALVAHAQDTGGSIESSDWGSEPSTDYGSTDYGSTDYGSTAPSPDDEARAPAIDWGNEASPPTDYGSSAPSTDYGTEPYPRIDYDTSSGSGFAPATSRDDDGWLTVLFVVAFVIVLAALVILVLFILGRESESPPSGQVRVLGPPASFSQGLVDVSMLQLAVDWRARRFVQASLAELARTVDTASKEGRARLLSRTTEALRATKLAWLYAGARNFRPMLPSRAQDEFRRIADDVRATYQQEIVRASAGRVVSVEAVGVKAKPHEGAGVVLVSVVVAARREIFDVDAKRSASLETLLRTFAALRPYDLVAVSIVWTPAAEEDRMSTDELEARHRHLKRIGDIGGRVFCPYCGGPHAEEVTTCPHCGAASEPNA